MRRIYVVAAAILALAAPAAAQSRTDERVRVLFDAGAAINAKSFTENFTLTKNAESTPVSVDLKPGAGGFVEGGARVRVLPSLWLGAAIFTANANADGTLNAQVPHPFYFNQPRSISGDVPNLKHSETGVHVEVAYPITTGNTGPEVVVFGGPTYVNASQELVTDFAYSDSYPYDTATFTSATTSDTSESGFGFNVGGEVTWRLNRSVGIGGIVRYSQVNLTFSPAPGNSVDVRAGGIHIGGAIRVGF